MGRNQIVEAETRDFQKKVEDLNLVDMKATGRQFTWTNKHVYSKIDKAICNEEWVMRIINALTDDDRFLPLIQQLWKKPVKGRGMTKLWKKMQLCKTPLK
ncbi:hypothetical protein P3L10_003956 [Capsicum annuum]